MKMTVQRVVCEDDGHEETITDVVILEKTCQQLEQVGLTRAEAQTLLQRRQQHLVEQQAATLVAMRTHCQACGVRLSTKGHHTLTFRTLFGTIRLTSPRLCHCPCTPHETATCSPLTALLPEHTAPALLFMETKWASLVSYGLTVQALTDFLPIAETLSVSTVRSNALAVAQRCEAALGEEQMSFIDGCPRDWGHRPLPDGPITVGIAGGYVRDWDEQKRQFEVIVGKSIRAFRRDEEEAIPSSKCFGFVQTLDAKPKRRLFEVLKSQGLPLNQQLTFRSAGGDTVRDLQLYLRPAAEHLLDWFHVVRQEAA
jgi:hypothetical protein